MKLSIIPGRKAGTISMKLQLVRSKTKTSSLADILSSLKEDLRSLYHEEAACFAHADLLSAEQQAAVFLSLSVLRDIIEDVSHLARSSHNPEEIVSKLGELSWETSQTIAAHARSPEASSALSTLARAVFHLTLTESRINQCLHVKERLVSSRLPTGGERILLPSGLLYLYHYCLFPAERMLVVAGSLLSEGVLLLGAPFDVTLEEEGGPCLTHVRADPEKLGRALLSMEYAGDRLAAWVHSHPGQGINATWPSEIDTRQHVEWIHDFHRNLLSIVMVENGFFRCFGQAIESGHVQLCIQGQGVKPIKEEEYVYQLTQEEGLS